MLHKSDSNSHLTVDVKLKQVITLTNHNRRKQHNEWANQNMKHVGVITIGFDQLLLKPSLIEKWREQNKDKHE